MLNTRIKGNETQTEIEANYINLNGQTDRQKEIENRKRLEKVKITAKAGPGIKIKFASL